MANMCLFWNLLLFLSVAVLYFQTVYPNAFTSIVKLQQLPAEELTLIEALQNFLDKTGDDHSEDRTYLEKFLKEAKRGQDHAANDVTFLEKPTNSFLMLRRLTQGWDKVTKLICENIDDLSVAKQVFCSVPQSLKRKTILQWPSTEDLNGAASAMIRLDDFYHFDFREVANGTIYGTPMLPFSVEDFLFIADYAIDSDQEYLASLWYSKTIDMMDKMNPIDNNTKTKVQRKLAALYYKNRMYREAINVMGDAVNKNPGHKGAERDLKLYQTARHTSRQGAIIRPEYFINAKIMSLYRRLCREDMKTPNEQSILFCRYESTDIPVIPTKVEYLHLDPPIVLMHEIINKHEILHVKNLATEKLARSETGGDGDKSEIRISQTAWLMEGDDKILMRMSRKVELHTGLSSVCSAVDSHAEPWQVLNYGLGGLYVPHHDSVKSIRDDGYESEKNPLIRNSGDRMATFLFYLSDVTAGGGTVFPLLKARVPVTKGSAVLWYNLHRNGTPDHRTLHAGCPVLIGSKWISNKWLREIGQTFRRPCALDKHL